MKAREKVKFERTLQRNMDESFSNYFGRKESSQRSGLPNQPSPLEELVNICVRGAEQYSPAKLRYKVLVEQKSSDGFDVSILATLLLLRFRD